MDSRLESPLTTPTKPESISNSVSSNHESPPGVSTASSSTTNDSPAFRLRPRRSTPRKCEQSTIGGLVSPVSINKRYTLYRPDIGEKKLRYPTSALMRPTKRTLFENQDASAHHDAVAKSEHIISKIIGTSVSIEEPTDDTFDTDLDSMQRTIHSDSKSTPVVLKNVDLGVFAEQLQLERLCDSEPSVDTAGYYVRLRIVHQCDSSETIQTDFGRCSRVLSDSSSYSLNQACPDDSTTSPTHSNTPTNESTTKPDTDSIKSNSVDHKAFRAKGASENLTSVTKTDIHSTTDSSVVRLLTQESSGSIEGPLWRPKQRLLLVYLHDFYAQNVHQAIVGKMLELVRFDVERIDADHFDYEHLGQKMSFWPFVLHMRTPSTRSWLPLVSIRDHVPPVDETNLLVQNGQICNKQTTYTSNDDHQTVDDESTTPTTASSERKEAMRFSSYVVKIEDSEQTVSLHETKSPTIKRFMKTISRAVTVTSNDKSPIKIKIKRNLS